MNVQLLVKMANDISNFFAAEPDEKAAVDLVANHLKKFWEPRMREQIRGYVAGGGAGLSSIALQAVKRLA
ncbi:MAG TPA: formate dehydrogenase subunit delta [Steroidobacteraceae bacterium]|jgi:formate dehydrogenase subunit delta|nr:formate dehydrogenase subunit delta [Steroidobacteraceae bacterium]